MASSELKNPYTISKIDGMASNKQPFTVMIVEQSGNANSDHIEDTASKVKAFIEEAKGKGRITHVVLSVDKTAGTALSFDALIQIPSLFGAFGQLNPGYFLLAGEANKSTQLSAYILCKVNKTKYKKVDDIAAAKQFVKNYDALLQPIEVEEEMTL